MSDDDTPIIPALSKEERAVMCHALGLQLRALWDAAWAAGARSERDAALAEVERLRAAIEQVRELLAEPDDVKTLVRLIAEALDAEGAAL
jgi:hypothetical protein